MIGELKIGIEAVAVTSPVEALEARVRMVEILLAERLDVLQKAAEIPASEGREGDQNCARFGTGLNEAEFGIARPERIFRLNSGDRVHGARSTKRIGGDFGEPDRADPACFDETRQFADRVFDRYRFVDAMHIVEVDVVDAEPLQRPLERFADVRRAVVEEADAVGPAADREFGRERDPALATGSSARNLPISDSHKPSP